MCLCCVFCISHRILLASVNFFLRDFIYKKTLFEIES